MFTRSRFDLSACGHAGGRLALAAALGLALGVGGASGQVIQAGPFVNPANGDNYYLMRGSNDWSQFQLAAQSMGGNLVTIGDADEQAWVHATFGGVNAYIGIHDVPIEGVYYWASGEPVGFTLWDGGAFEDAEARDYGYMSADGSWLLGFNGQWGQAIVEVPAPGQVCATATALVIDGPMVVDTTERARLDPGETGICGNTQFAYDGPALWFRFTGDGRKVRVTTCSPVTTTDSVLYVVSGGYGALECVGNNDDNADCDASNPYTSAVEFVTECGLEYFVAVKTFQHFDTLVEGGPFALGVETVPGDVWVDWGPYSVASGGGVFMVTSPTRPYDARRLAESMGGTLATIRTAERNGELADLGATFGYLPLIIGLSSCGGAGYAWLNGDPVTYTNWAPGDPDVGGNETFAYMQEDGTWKSMGADAQMRALIEFRNDYCEHAAPLSVPGGLHVFNSAAGTQQPNETPCGDVVGGGTWYRFEGTGDTLVVWVWPDEPGADLDATIRVFEGTCGDLTCLTGARDAEHEAEATAVQFYGEEGREYRVLVSATSASGGAFIEISQYQPTMPAVVATQVDPDECVRYVLLDSDTDWSRCEDLARLHGVDMVTIENADRNERVRAFAAANIPPKGTPYVWIGLTDRDGEGEFSWVDGSPVKFTSWETGQPDDEFRMQDYAMMSVDHGTWSDEHRDSEAYGVVLVPLTSTIGGKIRGCLDLSAQGNSVNISDAPVSWHAGALTVECWVRAAGPGVVLSESSYMGSGYGYVPMLYVGVDGAIRGAMWTGSVEASVVTGPVITDGGWWHVALTHNGESLRLIVNGEVVGGIACEWAAYGSGYYDYAVGYGMWGEWPSTHEMYGDFAGEIDELRTWNEARTPADLRATMSTRYFNAGLYAGLAAEYTFDEGGGRTVTNTVNSAPAWIGGPITWEYEDRDGDGRSDLCGPLCDSDLDANGVVNSTDVSEFINLWFADQGAGAIDADFNRDGVSNSTDVSDYINLWFEEAGGGCG